MGGAKLVGAAAAVAAALGAVLYLLVLRGAAERTSPAPEEKEGAVSARLAEVERRLARLEARLDASLPPEGAAAARAPGPSTAEPSSRAGGGAPIREQAAAEARLGGPGAGARRRSLEDVASDVNAIQAEIAGLREVGKRGTEVLDRIEAEAAAAKRREEAVAALKDQFNKRIEADRARYGADELKRLEDLYQKGSAVWGTDESLDAMRQVMERYPDSVRAGCSAVYLGEQLVARGNLAEAERTFGRACEQWGDCLYGDGVRVGAIARAHLAEVYARQGRTDDARRLIEETLARYPDAVDHRGRPLSALLAEGLEKLK